MEISNTGLPHVAILMATYNGEKFLRRQMDSLLAQQNVDVSIFVRDDNSTDNTIAILKEYGKQTGKVFMLDTLPGQLFAAKNFISIVRDVDLSAFDYIAYSDQDDIWLLDKLKAAISSINEEKVDCYACNLFMGDPDAKIVRTRSKLGKVLAYIFTYKSNKTLAYDFYFESASAGCTLVLNRQSALCLKKVFTGLYDKIPVKISHDWSTYAITRLNGFNWYIDSRPYIIYRQHEKNVYGANRGWRAIFKLVELFTSGWYRKHILLIDELYNSTGNHPSFILLVKNYRHRSIVSRFRLAFAVYKHRRKRVHRIMFFLLIIFGFCK